MKQYFKTKISVIILCSLKTLKYQNLINIKNLIIEKIDGCKNNHANSSSTKVTEQIPSGFSMSTTLPFKSIENKYNVYKGKDSMKKFSDSLTEHTM